jgi:hypothetical protein
MTGGARPSATAGAARARLGCAGPEAKRAKKRRVRGQTGGGVEGPPPNFDRWAAQANRKRVEGFLFFLKKEIKPKFKHKFEFNQPKLMLQHVCNSKLLYFIILINKMIKCLEKHKHLIFLKQERLLLSKFLIKHKGEI